ncbi:MAG: DUF4338 domain-containing protein [Verrucomicrobiae bacterium]|nr:DUF4338 domain-containing protein [Verrucomicrobiae bacterium]
MSQEESILQGLRLGPRQLEEVRALVADHPDWSRYRLSRQLATLWQWRGLNGQLKDMAARTLLLTLEKRGWIRLPERRWASPNRMRHKRMPSGEEPSVVPIAGPLAELLPLRLTELSDGGDPRRSSLFESLLHRHHYLSYRSPVGENLRYLVEDRQGRPVACALFGAAAWRCTARDRFLGWDPATQARQLSLLTNNTRFLVPAWVRVPQLASHVLGRLARRLSGDWQRKYAHPIHVVETFVERDRFEGTCYQAANWIRVGETRGRGRQGPDPRLRSTSIKDVYLLPLHPRFRECLLSPPTPPSPTHP